MFVARNPDNSIYGTWTVRQWEGQEELPDDHADVVAFSGRPKPALTPSQKLARVGLTIPELKALIAGK